MTTHHPPDHGETPGHHRDHRETPRYSGQEEEAPQARRMGWQGKILIVGAVLVVVLIIAMHAAHI